MRLVEDYIERVEGIPVLENALRSRDKPQGSNEWAVAPSRSASGKALLANDPHLALNTPATWYQNHLRAMRAGIDVVGSSFPGVPYVVLGQNRRITWGATVNPMDVTDTFQEQVVPDPSSPSGLSTIYLGSPEPLIPIPEAFSYNVVGDGVLDNTELAPANGTVGGVFIPPATLIAPRRNNGPIISIDLATGSALSVQYTGFSPTREFDAFRSFNFAKNLDEFKDGLQFFDFGSQNFSYMDTRGNIAYFTSAEMPIREDLQAGTHQRPPTVSDSQRVGWQRMAASYKSATRSSRTVRDLAVRRDAETRQSGQRLFHKRQQRPYGEHAGQQCV